MGKSNTEEHRRMNDDSPIRLVALDIDGTLLTSTKQISPATRAAVHDLVGRGVHVVLASARSPYALRLLLARLNIGGFVIAYTGALVCRLDPDPDVPTNVLSERRMDLAAARAAFQRARERGLSIAWYVGEVAHIAAWDPILQQEFAVTGQQPNVDPTCAFMHEAPHKLLCIAGEPRLIPQLHLLASDVPPPCSAQFSHTAYLEITDRGVNKAAALVLLAQQLGIDPAHTAAMGDHENDIAMLEAAGVGIAMGNAIPSVQAVADWITETNDRDGVALAIERLRAAGRL